MTRVGELGSVAGEVARFYSIAPGLRMILIRGGRGEFDGYLPTLKALYIREQLSVWRELEQLGPTLASKLRKMGSRA